MTLHFTEREMTRTDTGLPNAFPSDAVRQEVVRFLVNVLEPARVLVGRLRINSGYRSPAVNKAVGGSATSAHALGLAADVVSLDLDLVEAFERIAASDIPVDQLILEEKQTRGGAVRWLHIGYCAAGQKPRRQVLMYGPWTAGRYLPYNRAAVPKLAA